MKRIESKKNQLRDVLHPLVNVYIHLYCNISFCIFLHMVVANQYV